MGSLVLYLGLLATIGGMISLKYPLAFIGISSSGRGRAVLLLGLLAVGGAVVLPAPVQVARDGSMRLNAFVPSWRFGEVHEIRVHASPEVVYRALRAVTAEEIYLFRTLTWIRQPRFPWSRTRDSILNPPRGEPIIQVALRSGFLLLDEEAPREIVVGAIVCCGARRLIDQEEFARLDRPGFAKAGMNFMAIDAGDGWTRLRTETRVYATDYGARLQFGLYWRLIYPGSSLIRVMWLQAVKRRAEGVSVASASSPGQLYATGALPMPPW